MHQILDQINNLRKGAKQQEYSPEQLEKINNYLNGSIPFSGIKNFIEKCDSIGYDKKLAGEIAKAYKKDKSLAPVISRYTYLFNKVTGSVPLKHFLSVKFSMEDIFLHDPNGAETMLDWALQKLEFDKSYDDEVDDYPYFNYIEKIIEKYPDVVEQEALKEENCYYTTIQTLKNGPLLGYLYSKNPEKYSLYKEKILDDIILRLTYCFPENNSLCQTLKDAEKCFSGFELDVKDGTISDRHNRATYALYFGLIFTDFSVKNMVDIFVNTAGKGRSHSSFSNLCILKYAISSQKTYNKNMQDSVNGFVKSVAAMLGKGIVLDSKVYDLCIAPNPLSREVLSIPDWQMVDEIFGHDDALILKSLKNLENDYATNRNVISYVGWLWKQNRLTELFSHFEDIFLDAVHCNFGGYGKKDSHKNLVEWLKNPKGSAPNTAIEPHVDWLQTSSGICCFGLLHEKSETARCFARFLVESKATAIHSVIFNLKAFWNKNISDIFAYFEECGDSESFDLNLKKLKDEYFEEIAACKKALGLFDYEEADFGDYTPHTFTPELVDRMMLIKEKIDKLIAKSKNKYKTNAILHPGRIGKFETKNKFTLPDDYAWFLMNVGNGGTIGAGDGMFNFLYDNKVEGEFPYSYGQMFAMEENDNRHGSDNGFQYEKIVSTKCEQGVISIGDENAEGTTMMLVVNGKEKGTIWYVDFGVDSCGVFPLKSQQGNFGMTFAEWIEIWLDNKNCDYNKFVDYKNFVHTEL